VSRAALTACAGPGQRPVPAPVPAEPAIRVVLMQSRSDATTGRLQLRVTNDSIDDLDVRAVTLDSTALASPAVWSKGTTVPAGATRDLPVAFPGASCALGEPQTMVRVEAARPGGSVTVEVTPADPTERLELLTSRDCFRQQVDALADVSLGRLDADDAAEPALLEVRVDSAGGPGGLRIRSIESTTLFTPLDADRLPTTVGTVGIELRPGNRRASASVPIVPNRCDPHALAEDKTGTVFVVAAEIAGGAAGTISLPASDALRAELYDYFTRACGL
jgi:hypothetical protein